MNSVLPVDAPHQLSDPAARIGGIHVYTFNELERTGGRYGLQTMCEGGGLANATIIEVLS